MSWLDWIRGLFGPKKPPPPRPPVVKPPMPTWTRADVVAAINAERLKAGVLPLLVEWAVVDDGAQAWAEDNAARGVLDHGDSFHRIVAILPASRTQGEIIAEGQVSVTQVVSDWMGSPGHRARILDPTYTVMGSGWAKGRDGNLYWCVDFAG